MTTTFFNFLNRFGKKSHNPYPKSLSKRLTRNIMLVLFVVMAIPSLILTNVGFEGTQFIFGNVLSDRLDRNRMRVRRLTSDIYVAAVNTVPQIEENLDHPDQMQKLMERIVQINPSVNSCGISFKENYYPQRGRAFCPYASRRDSAIVGEILSDDAYLQSEWFTEALQADSGYWSKPFFANNEKRTPTVAFLVPIRDEKHQTVAVLGVDVSLEMLGKQLEEYYVISSERNDKTGEWEPSPFLYSFLIDRLGYCFLIDRHGYYLAHPDSSRIVKGNILTQAQESKDSTYIRTARLLTESKKINWKNLYQEKIFIDGRESIVLFEPIEHAQWTISFVMSSNLPNVLGYIFGGFLFLVIFIALIVVFFAGRSIIRRATMPIRLLAWSAREVAKGHFDSPLPDLKSRDEIHQLRDAFEQMQLSLAQYTDELTTTTAEKATIESELNIAHNIQMAMLPKTFPPYPERDDIDIYGQVTPAKAVGGDLFDFFIRDEKLFFCIGDVSGKGIPASMFMAVARSLFRNVAPHVIEPHIIVKALNESLCDGNDMNMFVTMFVGVIDLQTGVLHYCNAGHDAPLLIGHGVEVLPCDSNLPIGIDADWEFSVQETTIAPQTTIFLFTDGLNEAENIHHQQFGDDRILEIAKEQLLADQSLPEPLIQRMTAAVHFFAGAAEQSDDLTMLAIRYKGNR